MVPMIYTFFWLTLFGIALGFFEASVVVYLRQLYYPGAALFPLKEIPSDILRVEVLREFFSIVLMPRCAVLSAAEQGLRAANFLFIFASGHRLLHFPVGLPGLAGLGLRLGPALPHPRPVGRAGPGAGSLLDSLIASPFSFTAWPRRVAVADDWKDIAAAVVASIPILVSFFLRPGPFFEHGVPRPLLLVLLILGLAMAWGYAIVRIKQIKRFES